MEKWLITCLCLCIYGILKEHRPSDYYFAKYLLEPPMNFTYDEITRDVFPVAIYSSMGLLVILFLITDLVRYKPIIVLNSLAGIIIWTMLITCTDLLAIQIVEVFYGLFIACEIAYYTYIYAKVDKEHYQEVTGYTRAAFLIGRAVSGISAQIFVSLGFSYYMLNFFTLGAMLLSTIVALMLPSVDKSIYFNRDHEDKTQLSLYKKLPLGFKRLKTDFLSAFTKIYIIKWVFWWSLATAGYIQILTYNQLMWEELIKNQKNEQSSKLNGLVEAAYSVLSALAASLVGKLCLDWSKFGELTLSVCSLIMSINLYLMSQTNSIWIGYVTFIIFAVFYHAMITVANSEVAKNVNEDSHGLIFGFTTFLAFIFQSLITLIVVDYLGLDIRWQFVLYSVYFSTLGIIFVLKCLLSQRKLS